MLSVDQNGFVENQPPIGMEKVAVSEEKALVIVDEDNRVLLSVNKDGVVENQPVPEVVDNRPEVNDIFFIEENKVLRANEKSIETVFAPDFPISHISNYLNGFKLVADKPFKTNKTVLSVATSGQLFKYHRKLLIHFILYGQSLSVGARGQPLISLIQKYLEDSLMPWSSTDNKVDLHMGKPTGATDQNVVLDTSKIDGFQSLISTPDYFGGSRGETIAPACALSLQDALVGAIGEPAKLLFTQAGVGSSPYSALKKGTVCYDNLLRSIEKMKELAERDGYEYVTPAILLLHGEADRGSITYDGDLIQWQTDLNTDIKAITGQACNVHMLMGQSSSFFASETSLRGALANIKAHRASEFLTLVTPQYRQEYSFDELHMSSKGYFHTGEYFAKAILKQFFSDKGKWQPVMPKTVTYDGDMTIDIDFHVPVKPLVLDTESTWRGGLYGFEFRDSTSSAQVISVEVTSDESIRIQLNQKPTGTNRRICYAALGHEASPRIGSERAKGCLRDSDPTLSKHDGTPLQNWCVSFIETI
ncbi:hypothetical protein [Acinetobacter higginsii]|uniref:hypothetical protein n=1 Tax=Acinetobacter higginsii TaxID=70347 RepID=UPI001F4B2283|nr:hypothetical protein [Acinetobacter higginsii]MCH7339928.1 hypothetical protein [Acinetobacter higginsii]